ncbi:NAD(P)/FAD-dependent oxidoreductase [Pseudonocardia sp. WMMC193]|uniref:flavin-containing monooxygenase n=1 Tax=Pseudonocardia sp. WMMC193 TaxID=2911965 RepID=UPI001F44EB82|nr:NAD(P)/FAD-dependent oxidoreductase [Pseudonocardia sp. WMMC193]MCF7551496.1 NAD(P)/FAD-dependent oxidoreductase [Pseudonocardia sp. WMMC193]
MNTYDVLIVGAGFSGLAMLNRVRESGLSARVIEAGANVGGTWFWNRYPGARTDSECYYYCLSFNKELVAEWTWSERYPGQPEMQRYLEFVADRADLRKDITFSTRVTAMEYRDEGWDVSLDSGEQLRSRYVVTGLGFLTDPHVPDFPGLDTFSGDLHLTCRWPAEGVDLRGKRVGVIGTGATGVQAIPVIAQEAAEVVVFQRTPNYVVPAQNRPMDPDEIADLKARHYEILAKARAHSFAMPFDAGHGAAMAVDEDERRRIFSDGWARGGFRFLFETFDDLILDPAANEAAAEFIRSKIREIVHDPATAELLSPRGYPYSGKRPPAGHDYYEAYNRDNVRLVDVSAKGAPIQEITPTGLRTADASYELDVLVLATGFDAVTGALTAIDIRGRDGITLKEKWQDGPLTFLGTTTAGFPNLFMITGPLSPFANLPVCIEKNVEWIGAALDHAAGRVVEATEEAEQDWARQTREAVEPTLLTEGEGVHTWFLGANIPGKARGVNVWFGGANNYFRICDDNAEQGFPGLTLR